NVAGRAGAEASASVLDGNIVIQCDVQDALALPGVDRPVHRHERDFWHRVLFYAHASKARARLFSGGDRVLGQKFREPERGALQLEAALANPFDVGSFHRLAETDYRALDLPRFRFGKQSTRIRKPRFGGSQDRESFISYLDQLPVGNVGFRVGGGYREHPLDL